MILHSLRSSQWIFRRGYLNSVLIPPPRYALKVPIVRRRGALVHGPTIQAFQRRHHLQGDIITLLYRLSTFATARLFNGGRTINKHSSTSYRAGARWPRDQVSFLYDTGGEYCETERRDDKGEGAGCGADPEHVSAGGEETDHVGSTEEWGEYGCDYGEDIKWQRTGRSE